MLVRGTSRLHSEFLRPDPDFLHPNSTSVRKADPKILAFSFLTWHMREQAEREARKAAKEEEQRAKKEAKAAEAAAKAAAEEAALAELR